MKLSNLKNENKNNNASFDHMKINKANNLINNIQFNENISQIKLEENKICNNFYLELPSICYKLSYSYENIFTKTTDFSKYLKNSYFIQALNIFKICNSNVTKLFAGILSSNSDIQSNILQTLIYLYILTFFLGKNLTNLLLW